MVEEQEILNMKTGTKEAQKLNPKDVIVLKIRIEKVLIKNKENHKAVFTVEHPDRADAFDMSSVKYEKKQRLVTSGLWVNVEPEEKALQKGSALTILKDHYKAATLMELLGKKMATVEDEQGYLCFKAY